MTFTERKCMICGWTEPNEDDIWAHRHWHEFSVGNRGLTGKICDSCYCNILEPYLWEKTE